MRLDQHHITSPRQVNSNVQGACCPNSSDSNQSGVPQTQYGVGIWCITYCIRTRWPPKRRSNSRANESVNAQNAFCALPLVARVPRGGSAGSHQRIALVQLLGQHKVAVVQQACPRREQPTRNSGGGSWPLVLSSGSANSSSSTGFPSRQRSRTAANGSAPDRWRRTDTLVQPGRGDVRLKRRRERLAEIARRRRGIPRGRELRQEMKGIAAETNHFIQLDHGRGGIAGVISGSTAAAGVVGRATVQIEQGREQDASRLSTDLVRVLGRGVAAAMFIVRSV